MRAADLLGNYDLSINDGIEFYVLRLATRVQLTSDGHRAYLEAVEGAFDCSVDYAHWSVCMAMSVRRTIAVTSPLIALASQSGCRRQARHEACQHILY